MSQPDNGKKAKDDNGAEAAAVERTTLPIGVTPLFRQKNQVVCLVTPPPGNQKGGMIGLGRGNAYTLEFTLDQNPQAPGPQNLKFRTKHGGDSDAFWCDPDDCPTHDVTDGQYSNPRVTNGGVTLLVDAAPTGPDPSAVHYRLNFDNNCHFDPIIIHD